MRIFVLFNWLSFLQGVFVWVFWVIFTLIFFLIDFHHERIPGFYHRRHGIVFFQNSWNQNVSWLNTHCRSSGIHHFYNDLSRLAVCCLMPNASLFVKKLRMICLQDCVVWKFFNRIACWYINCLTWLKLVNAWKSLKYKLSSLYDKW